MVRDLSYSLEEAEEIQLIFITRNNLKRMIFLFKFMVAFSLGKIN